MAEEHERFRSLYEVHREAVYRYVLRRVDADIAPDVVAEVFLVAWRRFAEVPVRALPWLYGVARKVAANQRRSADRYVRLTEKVASSAPARAASAPDVTEAAAVNWTAMSEAFGQLGDDDREVLRLVLWEGLDASGAAVVLGCSIPAVTMRLHRARRRLRAALEQQGMMEET